ncbi:hypothetical protein Q9R29_01170 [Rothia sp. ARF10]|nr:hypothetical protein [Rothia sp. ARF10]
MWESPESLWGRLKLGREEFLQRLMTTLIVDGAAPRWNTQIRPGDEGMRFLRLLDGLAHGHEPLESAPPPDAFVDEYLLPKLEESAENGWPDWAVLWADRVWIIELKTEPGSHRPTQLPYYLRLAAAAHPGRSVDLTYITGPLTKPAPEVADGQRFSHVQWADVLPLVDTVWGDDDRREVREYVYAVREIVDNLSVLRPMEQRDAFLHTVRVDEVTSTAEHVDAVTATDEPLLELAVATAQDGRQRGFGAGSPEHLVSLRKAARAAIGTLPADDATRYVTPWVWDVATSGGSALTPEGSEFGYELRFSRYKTVQIKF